MEEQPGTGSVAILSESLPGQYGRTFPLVTEEQARLLRDVVISCDPRRIGVRFDIPGDDVDGEVFDLYAEFSDRGIPVGYSLDFESEGQGYQLQLYRHRPSFMLVGLEDLGLFGTGFNRVLALGKHGDSLYAAIEERIREISAEERRKLKGQQRDQLTADLTDVVLTNLGR